MKRLLWYGNCHLTGLHKFLELNPAYRAQFSPTVFSSFRVDLGEERAEDLVTAACDADVLLLNWLNPTPGAHVLSTESLLQHAKPGAEITYLRGPHDDGLFVYCPSWSASLCARIREQIRKFGIDRAAEHFCYSGDLDWVERSAVCAEKEIPQQSRVPESLRMYDFFMNCRKRVRLLLTHNHPSTAFFWPWATRVAQYLGIPFPAGATAPSDPNFAQLPCRDFICPASAKFQRLEFGAEPVGSEPDSAINQLRVAFRNV